MKQSDLKFLKINKHGWIVAKNGVVYPSVIARIFSEDAGSGKYVVYVRPIGVEEMKINVGTVERSNIEIFIDEITEYINWFKDNYHE